MRGVWEYLKIGDIVILLVCLLLIDHYVDIFDSLKIYAS